MATPPREKLTFSQAQGLEPFPEPLRLGELPKPVRNAVFAVLMAQLESSTEYSSRGRRVVGVWLEMLRRKHVHIDHAPPDELRTTYSEVLAAFKYFCFSWPFNMLLDVLEFFARQQVPGQRFLARELNATFEQYRVPYRLVEPGPSIIPLATEEEGRAVQEAFAALGADEFAGARKHLRDAGTYLGQPGRDADSIRESIHAVEAVCRLLADKPSATLSDALSVLNRKVPLHGAFADALDRLYGYTSDEKGIRHSLLDDEAAVDQVDAQFMFGTCAAFVSYLIGKARAAGAGGGPGTAP
jgi:hypothetical protein